MRSVNLEMEFSKYCLYQINPFVVLWLNLHCFDTQKGVGPCMVDPKMVRLCLCASLFQKNNNNSKNGLITIVKYYLYIYIYLEAYLNARLNSEYIFFFFSLGKSVASTTSGNVYFNHNMGCAGLNLTMFLLNHVLSSPAYFFLYDTLCPLLPVLDFCSSKSIISQARFLFIISLA